MTHKAIDEKTINNVAELARLSLSSEEVRMYTAQFSNILEYMNKLHEVDTNDVVPTAQVTGLQNVLREDVVTDSFSQNIVTTLAPESRNGYVAVHAVFAENTDE